MVSKKKIILKIFYLLFIFSFFGWSQDLLEPKITGSVNYEQGTIEIHIQLEENLHITALKNGFFKIELEKNDYLVLDQVDFPQGVKYKDEMVFYGPVKIIAVAKPIKDFDPPVQLKINVSYQICQEKPVEVCFPPALKSLVLTVDRSLESNRITRDKVETAGPVVGKGRESIFQWLERIIRKELQHRSLLLFVLVFLAGFITSLTPCVYPVIPIIMGYVGTRSGQNKWRALSLSLLFVTGMSFVYSVLGMVAALTGSIVGVSFQTPVVVIVIALLFIVMGLSLAGLFSIPIPASLTAKVQGSQKNEWIKAILIGGVSGLIAAPCVGPVFLAILTWISETKNIVFGFLVALTFSLGLGIIFFVVGTFSGVITSMPKGGKWMERIKYFFSLGLIAGGILIADQVLPAWISLLIWGVFLVSVSIIGGVSENKPGEDIKSKIGKIFLWLLLLIGAFLIFKGLDIRFFNHPGLANEENSGSSLMWMTEFDKASEIAGQENKKMMVDNYAEWCVACKELEKYTFSRPEVQQMLNRMVLVKLDFTKTTDENSRLKKRLAVIGLPTVIVLDSSGKEIGRFSGFKNENDFKSFLVPLLNRP